MNGSEFKRLLYQGDTLIGGGITDSGYSGEVIIDARFDWVFLDMETLPFDMAAASGFIANCQAKNLPCLVRLNDHSPAVIRQLLDLGATGIIAPMVRNRAEAEALVRATYYPPLGQRGLASSRRQAFGGGWSQSDLAIQNQSVTLIAMIEDAAGLQNSSEIAACSGIDGLLVGGGDLAAQLGCLGDATATVYQLALADIAKAAQDSKKAVGGMIQDRESAARFKQLGFSLVLAGLDLNWLKKAALNRKAEVKGWF